MKIVCQSCAATYKIADDKIQGKKVFKIKCKKCGEDILVRGTDAPMESPMDRPVDEDQTRVVSTDGGEAVWHAVLNGDQQGPYTVDQLRELMAQGAIDTETYVWRDGFENWLPMSSVPDLSALTISMPESATMMSAPPGEDLFGAASAPAPAPVASDLRASRMAAEPAKARTAPKSGDLFAPEAREQEAAKPLFAAEEPKAPPAGEHLTGQRNENSVLFSLATLQQLSGKETAKPMASNSADASGMIDINKLAGALNTTGGKKSSVDDIMTVGASSGLASPLSAPVLAPVAVPVAPIAAAAEPARPQGVNKTVVVTGVAVAAILVGGLVTSMYVINSKNRTEDAQREVAVNTPPPAPAANLAAPPAPVVPEAAPTPSVAAAPAAPPPAASETGSRERRDRDRPRERNTGSSGNAPEPTPAAAAQAPRPAAAPSRPAATGTRSIDDLLNAVGNPSARPAPSPSAAPSPSPSPSSGGGGDLPETPERSAVQSALRGLSSSVRACGTGQGGTAMVTIVFASSGRVTTANVGGVPPGPAVGCIVSAVRRASLPPFNRATFSVTYPYPLN